MDSIMIHHSRMKRRKRKNFLKLKIKRKVMKKVLVKKRVSMNMRNKMPPYFYSIPTAGSEWQLLQSALQSSSKILSYL